MNLLTRFFILIVILSSTEVSFGQTAGEQELRNTLVSMWDAIEKGDVDGYASFIHPDYTSFGENDPYLNEGKGMEIEGIRDWLKSTSNIHTEMHQPKITIVGNVGWIIYYWTDSGNNKDGTHYGTRGKSTRIFVKEGEKWLCIHGHFTSVQ